MKLTLAEAFDKEYEIRNNLLRKAFEIMLENKIVNFKKGYKKEYQEEFNEKLGNDFTIDAIESSGNLKLYSLKIGVCIYDVPIGHIIFTDKVFQTIING